MNPMTTAFAPFQLMAVAAKASLEAQTVMQAAMLRTLERTSEADVSPVTWVNATLPVPNPAFFFNENLMRENFQAMADSNLRGWEHAAEMLKALPNWANWPVKVPGSVMTDLFDRIRRNGMTFMPANDTWAGPMQAAVPAAFWAEPQPKGPKLLDAPQGEPDDLTRIKGIGAKLSALLNELGIFHFAQIAEWTEADGEWIDDKLAFKRRVSREDWIGQAKALVAESAAA